MMTLAQEMGSYYLQVLLFEGRLRNAQGWEVDLLHITSLFFLNHDIRL